MSLTTDIFFKQFESKYLKCNPQSKEVFTKLWKDMSEEAKIFVVQRINLQSTEKIFLCSVFPALIYYTLKPLPFFFLAPKWVKIKKYFNVVVVLTNERIIFKAPFFNSVSICRKNAEFHNKVFHFSNWKSKDLLVPLSFRCSQSHKKITLFMETRYQMVALDYALPVYLHRKFNHL